MKRSHFLIPIHLWQTHLTYFIQLSVDRRDVCHFQVVDLGASVCFTLFYFSSVIITSVFTVTALLYHTQPQSQNKYNIEKSQ